MGKKSGNKSQHNFAGQKRKANASKPEHSTENEPTSSVVKIVQFAQCRAKELEAMTRLSSQTWSNKKASQDLPRHMRRRAASHNVKRLPRRVREQALREMAKSGKPVGGKRPSRKHRRRASNLLTEYTRRQRGSSWLETHIWHAKRFHMTDLYNYKIALHPNDKGIRAAYRSSLKFCLMQDISYWCCIEVSGPQSTLIDGLDRLTHPQTGSSVGVVAYLDGTKEGSTIFHLYDHLPTQAVGPVKFLWKPVENNIQLSENVDTHRTIWLWTHPAAYKDIFTQIQVCFKIEPQEHIEEPVKTTEENTSDNKAINKEKSTDGHAALPHKRPRYDSSVKAVDPRMQVKPLERQSNGKVSVISLKDSLCRFRMTGPLSHTVLCDLLKPALIPLEGTDNGGSKKWWQCYYVDKATMMVHEKQNALWEKMKGMESPGELPPNCVLSLTVRDPRLFLPQKKTNVETSTAEEPEKTLDAIQQWPQDASLSPIWEEKVRDEVKVTKITDHKINTLRSQLLVPGSTLELGQEENRIPVMLIQSPGHRPTATEPPPCPLGYGAGWDVVLPAGWSMAFWLGLVFRGARAAGLQEERLVAAQAGQVNFPEDYPDTPAGQLFEATEKLELEAKYCRIPPAKRPNYIKLGVVAPYHYPWDVLIQDWQKPHETISDNNNENHERNSNLGYQILVQRDKRELRKLQLKCSGTGKLCKDAQETNRMESSDVSEAGEGGTEDILVGVRVKMVTRGTPGCFSMICIPTQEDLSKLKEDKQYSGPLEPPHPDLTKLKKNGKKKRKNNKKLTAEQEKGDGILQKSPLPEAVSVKNSCSREIIGFIKQGGFSLGEGKGCGKGFVVKAGLSKVLSEKDITSQTIVLVRETTSLQYRMAYLSIIT